MPAPAAESRRALAGPLLVLGAATSIQSGSAIATRLFDRIGPVSTVWLRLLIGAAALLLVARARRGRRSARFDLRTVLAFSAVAGAMNVCFYEAIDRLPLGVAVTIEFLGPLAVATVASRRRRDLVWLGLSAAGVAALGSPTVHIDGVGALFALGSGTCWAAFIVVGRRLATSGSLFDGLSIALAVAAVALTPAGLLLATGSLLAPGTLALAAVVAAVATVLPWALELTALRYVSLTAYGVLVSLEPAIAAVIGAIALSQRLGAVEVAATAAVVVASVGASMTVPQPAAPTP